MKTTVEISDALLVEARRMAARDGVTLRELIERGLQNVVSEAGQAKPFTLRKASVKGQGLQAELADASWETIRDMAYEGRGG